MIRGIHEQLLAATTPEEKFQILEKTLRMVSHGALSRDAACASALAELQRTPERLNIKGLAARIGLSQRQLLRHFDERVGLAPKTLARVFRFQRVVERLDKERRAHWADIAVDAGYYDQSHFVRDFRQFTGLNPSRYLLDRRDYGNYVPIR
jgi:methylphosphotriester-DNA--protein-cysteine methyltransferase